jgi:hypothetical protein
MGVAERGIKQIPKNRRRVKENFQSSTFLGNNLFEWAVLF